MSRKTEAVLSFILNIPILFYYRFVETGTHRQMLRECERVKMIKKASYAEIKEKMLSANWHYKPQYPESLFGVGYPHDNYFHADIFRFGEVGYQLTCVGLFMARRLQKKIAKSLPDYRSSRKPYVV